MTIQTKKSGLTPFFYGRLTLIAACLILALATALGAYASHGLDALLDPAALATFDVAVDFQFFHGVGLLGLALAIERFQHVPAFRFAAGLILVGVLLFSGGVIASSFDGPRALRMLAPVGGIALIVGWVVAAVGGLQMRRSG